jgi:hypothetical protein
MRLFAAAAASERASEKKWGRNTLAYGALAAATFGFDYICIEDRTLGLVVEGLGVMLFASALWSLVHTAQIRRARVFMADVRRTNPVEWRR